MKTTKKRLQELAAINNPFEESKKQTIKELDWRKVDAKFIKSEFPIGAYADVVMTITFVHALKFFNESAEELKFEPNYDDDNFKQNLADLIAENLEEWLFDNGGQWFTDGIRKGLYNKLK